MVEAVVSNLTQLTSETMVTFR